jgi:hypothetical protein
MDSGTECGGVRGVSIRAIFGGLFVAWDLRFLPWQGCLHDVGDRVFGITMAQAFSIAFDHSYARSNWISLGVKLHWVRFWSYK